MSIANGNKKLYYSISEVARMTGLEPYVLRYWEKEFPSLKPKKNRGGNRLYTAEDIELVNRIQHLRHSEKLTIAGARKHLTLKRGAESTIDTDSVKSARVKTLIGKIKREVDELLKFFP